MLNKATGKKEIDLLDYWKIVLKRNGSEIAAVKEKSGDSEKWLLDPVTKEEADRTKVEDFIRKIEALEAASFVDDPGPLSPYGFDAGTELRITTKDAQGQQKETVLLVGREDAEKKLVLMKSPGLGYLFRVDSGFLQDWPKDKKDWKVEPPQADESKSDKK